MRAFALLAALCLASLAVPAAVASATAPAAPECAGFVCDTINRACEKVGGGQCVGKSDAASRCVGLPCDVINAVCYKVFKAYCVA